jgi:hypothetical protein
MDHPSDQPPDALGANTSPCPPAAGTPRWLGLRITTDGTWWYRGSPIERIELVRLFASVLRREPDGSYWLVTPVERGRIEVDDVPFVAVELATKGAGSARTVRLRTNLDQWLTLGPDHPLRLRRVVDAAAEAGPVPYVEVRPGLEARLARAVYYELVELGVARLDGDRQRFGIWSDGVFFALDDA